MNRKCQVTGANLFMLLTDESPNTNDVICTVIFFMSLFIVMESPTKTCSRIIISFPGTFKLPKHYDVYFPTRWASTSVDEWLGRQIIDLDSPGSNLGINYVDFFVCLKNRTFRLRKQASVHV